MTSPGSKVSEIASVCRGTVYPPGNNDTVIHDLLIDSRRLVHPEHCMFVALVSDRNDGHKYIEELYEKGVRCFMVSIPPPPHPSPEGEGTGVGDAIFILVHDTLSALQQLGAFHRNQFNIPVIGITGSNGKTIVKEWLFQLLSRE